VYLCHEKIHFTQEQLQQQIKKYVAINMRTFLGCWLNFALSASEKANEFSLMPSEQQLLVSALRTGSSTSFFEL
jgi:hypothetical protein